MNTGVYREGEKNRVAIKRRSVEQVYHRRRAVCPSELTVSATNTLADEGMEHCELLGREGQQLIPDGAMS